MSCEGCMHGCQECYPWRCDQCGDKNKNDQDCDMLDKCEPCAEDERKYRARQKRLADAEGAADAEHDRRRDDGEL